MIEEITKVFVKSYEGEIGISDFIGEIKEILKDGEDLQELFIKATK